MIGRLYIDGNDAYKQYGVYVVQGGWNELIAYPPLKPVDCNDWQEEDGIEPDLSSPVLNSREISVKIAISGLYNRFNTLIELLSDGAYHTFECAYIQRHYKLRLVSLPNLAVTKVLGTATLKFADDFPLLGYKYVAPASNVAASDDYAFDGTTFTDYGVRVLKGTLDEVMKTPTVKTNLLRNIGTKSGAIYDGGQVTFKTKDVNIYCLMRAETLDELWRNYDALLFDLIRPDKHLLWVDELEHEFPFYYKNCQVTEFFPTGKVWLRFTITLTLIDGGRLYNFNFLSTQDGRFINTHDMLFVQIPNYE